MNIDSRGHDPKVLALYLPQYHETEYNNKWWGQGYTEWTAVKAAKPLFKGHEQPRMPLDGNYYDLSRKADIKKQIDMAHEYGVDGFAIYQYYSCGDKLLEIPTEMILEDPELDIPFFLFWVNQPWRKAWFGQDDTIIWEMKYGAEKQWREQFDYCLKFFKDERYIKVDNKPIYGIYAAWQFDRVEEFIARWNEWALAEGFDGIYFIKGARYQDKGYRGSFDAIVSREPDYTLAYDENFFMHGYRFLRTRLLKIINKYILSRLGTGIVMYFIPYDKVWEKILKRDYGDTSIIPGAFPDWDNSPRKAYNAYVVKGATPEKFRRYFGKLYETAKKAGSPFILINAWNEWAEGAYLEPDERHGYGYLEGIRAAKSAVQEKTGEKMQEKA
jgi:hypothetical protein